jgi:hypothetical protein
MANLKAVEMTNIAIGSIVEAINKVESAKAEAMQHVEGHEFRAVVDTMCDMCERLRKDMRELRLIKMAMEREDGNGGYQGGK